MVFRAPGRIYFMVFFALQKRLAPLMVFSGHAPFLRFPVSSLSWSFRPSEISPKIGPQTLGSRRGAELPFVVFLAIPR